MSTSPIAVYGIPNCETVKKSRAWLTERGLEYRFHDFKKQGVPDDLARWAQTLGWEPLLNRKGTTWRKLDATVQASAGNEAGALTLMHQQPSVIKRPLVDWGDGRLSVGFVPEVWANWLAR